MFRRFGWGIQSVSLTGLPSISRKDHRHFIQASPAAPKLVFIHLMIMKRHPMPMNHAKWIHHFGTANRKHRPEPDWDAPLRMDERKRAALAATLAQYQLGDGGGPCRLIARDAERLRAGHDAVRQVIDLWFAEEAEHSRLLGGAVRRLRGTFVEDSFAFRLFNRCRRAFGAQFEMKVLLIVEIVSTAYYRLIRKSCGDEPIGQMCRLILRDESGHITFHRDRLAGSHPGGVSRLWTATFYGLGAACAAFLWLSHGRWLRPLGIRARELFALSFQGLIHFRRRLPGRRTAGARGGNDPEHRTFCGRIEEVAIEVGSGKV